MTFNQSINTSDIRRETLDGTEYVVAPVTILKNMYLNAPGNWSANEAYLPKDHAEASAPSWNGTPLTLGHPTTANGVATTANSPEMHEKTVLGRVFNAEPESGAVDGEAWFDEEKIRNMGGMAEKALDTVLDEGTVEVSSGYRASKLPSGEYDGQTHNAVQGNIKPDHVAVLPNAKGKCSIESGCGVGEAVANEMVVTNAKTDDGENPEDFGTNKRVDGVEFSGVESGELDESEIPSDGFEDHYVFDGRVKTDSSYPVVDADGNLRKGNVRAAWNLRGHARDEDRLVEVLSDLNDEFDDPPISDDELEEAMSANSSSWWGIDRLLSFLGRNGDSVETKGAESPADTATNSMDREKLIEEITENSKLSESALEERCNDGLEAIHNDVMAETDDEPTEVTDDMSDNVKEITEDELEELISNRVDERLEEQQAQNEKEQLASEIVDNSDEYDSTEAVLEDYPTVAALNTKQKDVAGAEPDFSGSVGANAQPATNTEDADDLKIFGSDA